MQTNASRGRGELEYELIDTGVFDDDRYFDVFVEYAKAAPEDLLMRITAHNRGPDPATLHLLPTLWFRNTWWGAPDNEERPRIKALSSAAGTEYLEAKHPELGTYRLVCSGTPRLLVVDNETNEQRVFGTPNRSQYVKDGINDFVVAGAEDAVNPAREGTKAAAHYQVTVAPARVGLYPSACSKPVRAALSPALPSTSSTVSSQPAKRRPTSSTPRSRPPTLDRDGAMVMRQALAGMLWTKQCYIYDVNKWLRERSAGGAAGARPGGRNSAWFHMVNQDIISMPDKWEYPWFAAWDLAFHTIALSMVDLDFAKQQLELMLRRELPPPQRPDPRLRVGLRRREPAGPRLGGRLHLQSGAGERRAG